MNNHTEGPWGASDRFIWSPHARGHIAHVTHDNDARLIAAAPELLASVMELINCIQPDRDWHEAKRARAAIAKATGGADADN